MSKVKIIEGNEMSKPHGVIVFGANGSGKTTFGRELSRLLDFKHIDHEVYAFKESRIPYTEERSYENCLNLMLTDIEEHGSFVLSAVTGNFGDKIPLFYELAVYISAPLDLRITRIEQREYERHGERVRKGGDMYESCLKFINFVASRSLARIEQWAETLTCPVIRIDGTEDWGTNATYVAEQFYGKNSL